MARFKFANPEHTVVSDLEANQFCISPGVYLWSKVQDFLDAGGVIEDYQTHAEKVAEAFNTKMTELNALKKKEKDDEGVVVNGVLFDTDIAARVAYIEMFLKLMQAPEYVVKNWKASEGVWVKMDKGMLDSLMAALAKKQEDLFNFIKEKTDELVNADEPSQVVLKFKKL